MAHEPVYCRCETGTLGLGVSDLVPLIWWERLEKSKDAPAYEATLRYATALAQDGMTGVSVVLPRTPGLLVRARAAAAAAGVVVRAERIGSAAMTLRFSAEPCRGEPLPPSSPRYAGALGLLLRILRRA